MYKTKIIPGILDKISEKPITYAFLTTNLFKGRTICFHFNNKLTESFTRHSFLQMNSFKLGHSKSGKKLNSLLPTKKQYTIEFQNWCLEIKFGFDLYLKSTYILLFAINKSAFRHTFKNQTMQLLLTLITIGLCLFINQI